MVETANYIWRDYTIESIPSSGPHNPIKREIRDWGTWLENAVNIAASAANLQGQWDASTGSFPPGALKGYTWVISKSGTIGGVSFNKGDQIIALVDGASTGSYAGNWITIPAGTSGVTKAVDAGDGTANAIKVTTEDDARDGNLLLFNLMEAATSAPITVSIDGGPPLTVKSNTGINASSLIAGQFIAGQIRVASGELRLLNDQDVSGLVAQAVDAANRAEAAAAGVEFPVSYAPQSLTPGQQAQARDNIGLAGSVPEFATKTAASAATIAGGVDTIFLSGWLDENDGLGGRWVRDPLKGSGDVFSSVGGASWYRLPDVSDARRSRSKNLIPNAEMREGFAGWPAEGPGTVSEYNGPEGRGLLITKGADTGQTRVLRTDALASPVVPGDVYEISLDVTRKAGATYGGNVGLLLNQIFIDDTKVNQTTGTVVGTSSGIKLGETRTLRVRYEVPAKVKAIGFQFYHGSNAASANNSFAITNIKMMKVGENGQISSQRTVNHDRLLDAPELVQKKMMEAFFGDPSSSGSDTQIYPGAQYAAQSVAYTKAGDNEYLWVTQRCVPGNYTVDERCRIVQFQLRSDGSVGMPIAFSKELNIGHGGGISVITQLDGSTTIIACMETTVGHEGTDSGKGISVINWRGSLTDQSDVTAKQLFGYAGSNHPLQSYGQSSPSVSPDKKYLVMKASRKPIRGPYNPTVYHSVIIYDFAEVITASNPMNVKPIGMWNPSTPRGEELHVSQGIAVGKDCIAMFWGFGTAFAQKAIQLYSLEGTLLREIRPTLQAGEYGIEGLLNHPTLGVNSQMEPEGICFRGDDELLTMILDTWVSVGDIVSVEGSNYVIKTSSTTAPPYDFSEWSPTTRAATKGEWSPGTYTRPSGATRRAKVIWSVRVPKADPGEKPLYAGFGAPFYSMNRVDLKYKSSPNIEFVHGSTLEIASYSPQYDKHFRAFTYGDRYLRVYDPTEGKAPAAEMRAEARSGREYATFGGSTGGAIAFYGSGDASFPGAVYINNGDGSRWRLAGGSASTLLPGSAGQNIGETATRVGTIYLQNAPNVSSDERIKSPIRDFTDAEMAVAKALSEKIGIYTLLSGGEKLTTGLGAQTVVRIFDDAGLDAMDYNLIHHDAWDEEPEVIDPDNGEVVQEYRPAGDGYSIRYEEALAFIMRGMAQRLAALEAK